MDIPDEAYAAAAHWADGQISKDRVHEMVKAAAPHIERAAQVSILREMADEDEQKLTWIGGIVARQCVQPLDWDTPAAVEMRGLEKSMARFRAKADALEAGAGQTGADDA